MFNIFTHSVFNQLGKMEKQLGNSSQKKADLGIMCLIIFFLSFGPDFFYFLVLGSADRIFSKTGIKIKLLSLNFIFFIAADRNFPPHGEIKYRIFFAGELCAGTPSRR